MNIRKIIMVLLFNFNSLNHLYVKQVNPYKKYYKYNSIELITKLGSNLPKEYA